jgi:hypothetical protein
MSKGPQCRKAACQNAGVRIDQGAVEVQKNRGGHDPKIAAKGKPVQVPGILSGERLIQNVWNCGRPESLRSPLCAMISRISLFNPHARLRVHRAPRHLRPHGRKSLQDSGASCRGNYLCRPGQVSASERDPGPINTDGNDARRWSRNPFHNTLRGLWVPAFAGTTVGCACARRRLAMGARASRSSPGAFTIISANATPSSCRAALACPADRLSPDCRIALLSADMGRWRVIRRETWANERFHDWQRRSRLRRERGPVGEVFCHRLVMGIC